MSAVISEVESECAQQCTGSTVTKLGHGRQACCHHPPKKLLGVCTDGSAGASSWGCRRVLAPACKRACLYGVQEECERAC